MHNKFARLRESRKQNNEPITVVHIPSIYFCPIFVDPDAFTQSSVGLSVEFTYYAIILRLFFILVGRLVDHL